MSVWSARGFWKTETVVPAEGGFTVQLDARPVRTPLKAPLILPTLALAEAVAAEWQAQAAKVDPEAMPFTRTANSAIDKVAPQFGQSRGSERRSSYRVEHVGHIRFTPHSSLGMGRSSCSGKRGNPRSDAMGGEICQRLCR